MWKIVKWLRKKKIIGIQIKDIERTYKDGDKLSEQELEYMRIKGTCPDCEDGLLLEGPSGGMCTNFMCSKCGSKFNMCPPVLYQRISNSSRRTELWDSYRTLIKYNEKL